MATTTDPTVLENAFRNARSAFIPYASRAVGLSLVKILGIWSVYPPQPQRDRAKTFNTYVRGKGQYPKSAFVADSNRPGGFKVKRVKKGKIRLTSQVMSSRFKTEVTAGESNVTGRVSNDASYAVFTIGSKDDQVPPHKLTGWTTTDDALDLAMPYIDQIQEKTIDAYLRDLLKG